MKSILKPTLIFAGMMALCYLWYAVGAVLIDSSPGILWRISPRDAPVTFSMAVVFAGATIFLYVRKLVRIKKG